MEGRYGPQLRDKHQPERVEGGGLLDTNGKNNTQSDRNRRRYKEKEGNLLPVFHYCYI